jgi:hypothetical protein
MSPFDSEHFTDMDGNALEDAPEPLPCPFRESNASSAAPTVPRGHSARGGAGMERTAGIAASGCGTKGCAIRCLDLRRRVR